MSDNPPVRIYWMKAGYYPQFLMPEKIKLLESFKIKMPKEENG